jgi:hypothetical protein
MFKKCKTVPVTDRGGPEVCGTSRLPYFLDNELTEGGDVSLTRRLTFYAPRAIVRLESLDQLKKSNELMGNRTRDLPACSLMPQATTLPRARETLKK